MWVAHPHSIKHGSKKSIFFILKSVIMNAEELTKKHLRERIDLESLQGEELTDMLNKHLKEEEHTFGSRYFAEKRTKQVAALLTRHGIEKERLYDAHMKEYNDWRKVKNVIRESQQLSFDLSEKGSKDKQQAPQKQTKETIADKIRKMLSKKKDKDYGHDL
jgi:coenzyme F420-reducing hydrogenase delta subunit